MPDLNILEIRALLSRSVNAAVNSGATPLEIAMIMDSIKADLLIQVPYKALADQQAELTEANETTEGADANV